MAEVLNPYEGMFLLGPTATAEPEAALNMVRQTVERHGGQIMVIKKWDERKLAYEISRQKRGTYIICFFRAPGTAISGMERDVRLSEQMLRCLILRADHLNEQEMAAVEPQPIVREERNPWDRGFEGGDRPRRDDRDRDRGPRPPRRDEREAAPAAAEAAAPNPADKE